MIQICLKSPWSVIPAKERVKESATRLKSGPQRRPREGGDPYKSLFQLGKWIPAFERVKKSANRLNPGRSVVPAKAGTHAKVLFLQLKWIPAFAGMTLQSLAKGCNFDFFTRSKARIHAKKWRLCIASAFILCAPAVALAGDWIADAKTGCKVWNPQPSAGETARWSGPCKDGFADGKGALDWLRGNSQYERDEGVWRAGRQTGEGAQTWPGGQYKGQFLDSLPHGKGVLISGEARYDGAFLNGKPNGKGAMTNASGTFDGTWADGCFNDGKRRAAFGVSVQSCP